MEYNKYFSIFDCRNFCGKIGQKTEVNKMETVEASIQLTAVASRRRWMPLYPSEPGKSLISGQEVTYDSNNRSCGQ